MPAELSLVWHYRRFFFIGVHRKGKGIDGCAWFSIWTPHIEMNVNNSAAIWYSHHAVGKCSVRGHAVATGISFSAYVGVSICLFHRRTSTRWTTTLQDRRTGLSDLWIISPETRHDCRQGGAQRPPQDKYHGTHIPNTRRYMSGLAGTDSSTFQAFYVFGQFLSPRVFLTLVSGKRRVKQGNEKLHSHPAGPVTP